ncbi:MAG: trigger factor [Clostridiales bacterium]|nr:trigger factor [Clostridiales bacterium]
MKPMFISKDKNEVHFSIEFSAEEFDSAIVDAYRANKSKFIVPGFRKGKAPRKLIEAHYGEEVFFDDAIDKLTSEGYPKSLDELEIEVIAQPKAEFSELKQGEGFTVSITVEVYPEFDVKDYKNIAIVSADADVTEEDVAHELESLQKRNARIVAVDKPAAEGDMVLIDYVGYVDGAQFEGGTAERHPLQLGSGSFIPGFEEQLVGVSAGDELDVSVVFPSDYHSEDLAGRDAVFKCKVHEIKEEELPELNDDFAKDVSEHDTLEELEGELREKLIKSRRTAAENQMKDSLIEKISNSNDIDVPVPMIEDEVLDMINEFGYQLKYQGVTLEQYYEYSQKDEDMLRSEFWGDASRRVKTRMLMLRIADQENLEASQEEIEQEMRKIATQYKMDIDKIRETIGKGKASFIEKDVRIKKALDFIFDSAIAE